MTYIKNKVACTHTMKTRVGRELFILHVVTAWRSVVSSKLRSFTPEKKFPDSVCRPT